MPELTSLLNWARDELGKQGVKTTKLIYGRDGKAGYEIGTEGADKVNALDLNARKLSE